MNDDVVASHTQSGLAGNSISSGMSLSLSRPTDFPSLYVDDLTPVAGAEATLESPWGYSSVNYRGDYSRGGFGIVFLSAPFEAISTAAADPNNQKVMMQRIMTYLDNGTPSPFVLTAPSSYTTSESGSGATFGVRLAYEPTDTVTIPVSSSDTSEGTVAVTLLTFTPSNWNATQNIAVSAVNDAVDDGDIAYRIILGAATSNDARFNGAEPVDLYLTNIDNDTRGISVSPPSGTATTEGGGTVTFSVKLNSQPTANVTIAISSSDTTEGTVSTNQLTFTSSNWNTAQTVTVSGVNDNQDDGDIAYTAVIGTSSSTDTLYNGINPADITLTNLDNDTAGINVSAPSGTSTTESGGQVSFSVKLETQPTATVTLPIGSSNTTEGTVSTNQLTFTTSNWNTPQTVTVTGADDGLIDGTIAYTALIGTSSSADTLYNGLDPADIALTNLDNDAFGITISEPSSTTTSEAGGQATFTVKLNSQPTGDVTIPISSSNTREGSVSPGQLVFTSANWNTAQTVTVTGVNDDLDDGDIAYSILLGNAISSDSTYNGLNPEDVAFVNSDNDTAGITVSAPSRTTTSENGDSATFSVRLNSQPTANVTINLSSSDTTEGSVAPASLTFTASDWSTPQTVTVSGVNDDLYDGTIAYAVVIAAAASSDGNYNGINPDDLNFSNTDNDPAPVTKFFVVDDGTSDRTFEYSASGARVEDYPTATTAPRGIATTAAGTTTWVVDNAKKIFVYNDSGASQGSWTLGGLASNAALQGVATDGTHLWVLDATTKRVYYYANAASRRSSNQKATSNFALAAGNANPTDLVFGSDGSSRFLWVVNNSTSDSVFHYTLGTNNLLATNTTPTSWTLDSSSSTPTGITLDPSNGSQDIWVVDSGTDRVYRYANARTLTTPTLTDSFALAAGNTNPQGIADPVALQPGGSGDTPTTSSSDPAPIPAPGSPSPQSVPASRRRRSRRDGVQPWRQAGWNKRPAWAWSWWLFGAP